MKNQEHRDLRSLPKLVDLHVKNSMVTYLKISIKFQYRCRPAPNNCNQIWEIQIAPTAHEKCPNQATSDGEGGRGGVVCVVCWRPLRGATVFRRSHLCVCVVFCIVCWRKPKGISLRFNGTEDRGNLKKIYTQGT